MTAMKLDPDRLRAELDRVTASAGFRESPSLSSLLQFVVSRELEGRGGEVKESTIAIEVFGRGADFDGRLDNSVRVNASRLRSKLAAYYADEGRGDEVVIEIPRGSYVPQFTLRSTEPIAEAGAVPSVAAPVRERGRLYGWKWAAGVAALVAVAAFLSYWAGVRSAAPELHPAVRAFFSRLWTRPVVLVYRVPVFLRVEYGYPAFLLYGGHTTGMTYESMPVPSDLPPEVRQQLGDRLVRFENTWTDVGSLHGVYEIANIFGRAGAQIALEDTLSVTADQCRNQNLIVVSPPWFNALVNQLPNLRYFEFDPKGSLITGRTGKGGAPEQFRSTRDATSHALRATFGFVSLGAGIWPGTRVLRISGTDPIGVHGAAGYIASAAGLEELARGLGGRIPEAFEAVLAVNCMKGQVSSVTLARAVAVK